MVTTPARTSVVAIGVLLCALGCHLDQVNRCESIDPTKGLDPKIREFLEEHSPGWLQLTTRCRVGQFNVYGPSEPTSSQAVVSRDSGTLVAVDGSGNMFVFQDNRVLLSLRDQDADGHFDSLDYDVYQNGDRLNVKDNNLDGQADFRWLYRSGGQIEPSMWYENAWRSLDLFNAPQPNRMLIEGEWRPYRIENGQVLFLEQ